jgi:hypothetical protein
LPGDQWAFGEGFQREGGQGKGEQVAEVSVLEGLEHAAQLMNLLKESRAFGDDVSSAMYLYASGYWLEKVCS